MPSSRPPESEADAHVKLFVPSATVMLLPAAPTESAVTVTTPALGFVAVMPVAGKLVPHEAMAVARLVAWAVRFAPTTNVPVVALVQEFWVAGAMVPAPVTVTAEPVSENVIAEPVAFVTVIVLVPPV